MLALYIFFPHHVTCVGEQDINMPRDGERKYIKLAFYYFGTGILSHHFILQRIIKTFSVMFSTNQCTFLLKYNFERHVPMTSSNLTMERFWCGCLVEWLLHYERVVA